ncbi:MAG: DUF1634 domain-containing protein [Bacillota bacterium]
MNNDAIRDGGCVGGAKRPAFDMEIVISYVLITGVAISLILLVIGTTIYALAHHSLDLAYALPQDNLYAFIALTFTHIFTGVIAPTDVINLGIIVLMLTPYVRVFFSAIYFGAIEHNVKYTLFTSFVLAVLTYSLFLRL